MAIYKRGKIWWMDVYVGAKRRRLRQSTGCTDEHEARIVEQTALAANRGLTPRQRAIAVIEALLPDEAKGLAIDRLWDFYREAQREDGSSISAKELGKRLSVLNSFAAWAKDNTRCIGVDGVTPEVAWRYSCRLGEGNITAKTRNHKIAHLSAVWKTLIKRGVASQNPWSAARVARKPDEERSGRAFTAEEFERIVLAAREIGFEWEPMAIVGAYTGLRKGDIENLRWEDIDFEAGCIDTKPRKTAKHNIEVHMPLHPRVIGALGKVERKSEWIFPWRRRHTYGHKLGRTDRQFSAVLAKAGIVEKSGERLSFHSLRHTFVTRLAEAGVAADVRMRLAGHTNLDTHLIYTHGDSDEREAIGRLK